MQRAGKALLRILREMIKMDLWGQTEVREKGMDRQIQGRVILLLLDQVRARTMTWKQRVY